jgi:hypothetical protein
MRSLQLCGQLFGISILSLLLAACGPNSFSTISANQAAGPIGVTSTGGLPAIDASAANVVSLQVGCRGVDNAICANVTICTPGTNTCQTISDILVDTGSVGLRIYSSLVHISLPQVTNAGGKALAECVPYAGGNSTWGPLQTADVVLGSEKASSVPIQIINKSFAGLPSGCANPNSDPNTDGYNGILGVGLFAQDCGTDCVALDQGLYYACASGVCTGTTISLAQQVTNPVAVLPTDNNGVIIQLQDVPSTGATYSSGYMLLGVSTQANNKPTAVTTFPAKLNASYIENPNFQTQFAGINSATSYIDSGTTYLYLPANSSIPSCGSSSYAAGFFCPSSLTNYVATIIGGYGTPTQQLNFQVLNANDAFTTTPSNKVFNDIAVVETGDQDFVWGAPFFLGKTVAIGIENRASSLGTGPYWAY